MEGGVGEEGSEGGVGMKEEDAAGRDKIGRK